MTQKRVLIIEDDADIAQLLRLNLEELCSEALIATDGEQGLKLALAQAWDAIILDLRLPNLDGLEVCRRIRQNANYTPILMLTAKSSELDRVLGLELGADDYLTKPFSVLELVARVKALFRRSEFNATSPPTNASKLVCHESMCIALDERKVTLAGDPVDLTAREFDLLAFLASHPGKVYRRSQLLDQVWGYGHDGYEHTVNSHMNRLRAKIEDDPGHPVFIQTVWGVGYKFEVNRA